MQMGEVKMDQQYSMFQGIKPTVAIAVAMIIGNSVASAQQAVEQLEEVRVTASRIQRSGFEAPTPTTVIGSDIIESRAAVRVSQVLFEIPALRPTATAVPFSSSAGGTYANLRNLNPLSGPLQSGTRTLVLVDGRRVVPNTATGLVDLNAIPTSLIERVEVVTGGASAAWGSDAVAGVTNFILKKKVDGLDFSAQYGMSQRKDAKERSLTAAWGHGYAGDRGQIMFAAEYSSLDDIPTYGDRDWGSHQYGWINGTAYGLPNRVTMAGVTASGLTAGGVITQPNGTPIPTTGAISALRGLQFGPGGTVVPFRYGSYLGNNQMVGGDGAVLSTLGSLGAPTDRFNAYGRTTFDFSDKLSGFAELAYAESKSVVDTQPMYLPNGDGALIIQRDNAFLPASLRTTMVTNNITSFGVSRWLPEFGRYSVGASRSAVTRGAAGLNGELGQGWKWKAYVGAGSTDYYDKALNNINEPNLRAAVDTVVGPGGTPICRINSTVAADIAIVSAANYQGRGARSGCVAANPFGPNSFTQAAIDYIIGTSSAVSKIKESSGGASVQGEPFGTWAGSVSLAAGLDYRKDSVDQVADATALQTSPAYQTGAWQFSNRRPLKGSVHVTEFFAETVVPLAKDLALARALDLNAAVRTADYSTSGSVTSWKAGLTYEPVDGFRIRGTRSRDIRAANLNELYTVGVTVVGAVVDYGRTGNPSASVPTTTVGNQALKPETAKTTTVGMSWRPSFLPGFETSIDYYKINIQDAIGSLGGQNIVNACYGKSPFTSVQSTYCSLISRDANGVISNILNQNLNLAFVNTRGVDLEAAYRFQMSDLIASAGGSMNIRILGTYVDKSDENNGIVTVDRAGQLGNSHWRVAGSVNYANGPFAAYMQVRFIEPAKIDNTYGPNDIANNRVPARTYVNTSAQYTLFDSDTRGRLQIYGNINNLFDKDPPIIPSASATPGQTTLSPDYDKIGRYFALGARYHF